MFSLSYQKQLMKWCLLVWIDKIRCSCLFQKCSLNLHQTYSKNKFDIPGIVSKPEAPGLILAHGRVGDSLYNGVQARVFISRDAGLSWRQVMVICCSVWRVAYSLVRCHWWQYVQTYLNICLTAWNVKNLGARLRRVVVFACNIIKEIAFSSGLVVVMRLM